MDVFELREHLVREYQSYIQGKWIDELQMLKTCLNKGVESQLY
jgi:hypothetical protein